MKNSLHFSFSLFASSLGFVRVPTTSPARELSEIGTISERKLLGPHYEGRLVPVETENSLASDESLPLILVHGLSGSAENFADLLPSVPKLSQYQLFYFAYDDLHRSFKRSALELAQALRRLRAPRITILAHSLGGLITREALNILAGNFQAEYLPEVHVIAIDCPWYGGSARGCELKNSPLDSFIELFLPAAISDMRACSHFFKGLFVPSLPEKFSITLFFAEDGEHTWNCEESPLKNISQKIVNFIAANKPITGSLAEIHFWNALRTSSQYSYFEVHLHTLQKEGALTANQVRADLQIYFPCLPGNQMTVLSPHPTRKIDLPRYLEQIL